MGGWKTIFGFEYDGQISWRSRPSRVKGLGKGGWTGWLGGAGWPRGVGWPVSVKGRQTAEVKGNPIRLIGGSDVCYLCAVAAKTGQSSVFHGRMWRAGRKLEGGRGAPLLPAPAPGRSSQSNQQFPEPKKTRKLTTTRSFRQDKTFSYTVDGR